MSAVTTIERIFVSPEETPSTTEAPFDICRVCFDARLDAETYFRTGARVCATCIKALFSPDCTG